MAVTLIWPWLTVFQPERNYMIFTIICWVLSGPQFRRWNRLHTYFLLFVLTVVVSALNSPYRAVSWASTQNYLKLVVFYVVLVTSVRSKNDLRILVAGLVGALTLYAMHSLREYNLGRVIVQQGLGRLRGVNSTFGDQNFFAGIIVMSLPFAWVLWRNWSGWWKRGVVGCLGLLCWCVIRTGSRMGFIGLLAAASLAAWTSPKRRLVLVLSPLIVIGLWTVLPEGQKVRYLTLLGEETEESGARVEEGFRSWGFWWGWEAFQERPLLGFGPQGTRIAIGEGRATHNSYGELFGDLGAAGVITFGLVFLGIAQNFLEGRRLVRSMDLQEDLFAWHTVAAATAGFVLLAFLGWGLHFLYYFPWLWFGGIQAVALDCLKEQAEENSVTDVGGATG